VLFVLKIEDICKKKNSAQKSLKGLFSSYNLIRHGNGAGWGRALPSPSPSPTPIYLPVTLPIPNGDEKLNLIPVPNGFGYTQQFEFFLSFNGNVVMHYPTIWAHFNISLQNNLTAHLTINESSHIMTIINPNNMAYHYQPLQQNKNMTFLHSGRVLGMSLGWVQISLLPVPNPYFEIRENPNSYPNLVQSEKTRQIRVSLGGYQWARVLLPCLILIS